MVPPVRGAVNVMDVTPALTLPPMSTATRPSKVAPVGGADVKVMVDEAPFQVKAEVGVWLTPPMLMRRLLIIVLVGRLDPAILSVKAS
jgi:hypothetical protein